MKEIETHNMKVMMSDSLTDKIDVRQFYENPVDISDITASISVGSSSITVPINKIKITNSLIRLNFFCNSKTIPLILFSKDIDIISFFIHGNSEPVEEYRNFTLSSRSAQISEDSVYECDLVVKLHNT
jgi:hypothetical protein